MFWNFLKLCIQKEKKKKRKKKKGKKRKEKKRKEKKRKEKKRKRNKKKKSHTRFDLTKKSLGCMCQNSIQRGKKGGGGGEGRGVREIKGMISG